MPCSPSTVRRVPEPLGPSGRARLRLLVLGALLVAVVAVLVLRGQRLEWRGRVQLGPGPLESYVFANRSGQPGFARIVWADDQSAPIFLPPRSTIDVDLPVSRSGGARTDVFRVQSEGAGVEERTLRWTTAADERLVMTLEADGRETCEVVPKGETNGFAELALRSRCDRPALVFLEDLESLGGMAVRDDAGLPQPIWITPGGAVGTSLQPGRDARLRYRLATLTPAASITVDSREGASHEIVLGDDGSVSGGSLSLRTRAGY